MVKVRKSHMAKKRHQTPKNVVGPVVRKLRLAANPPITQDDLVARLEVKGLHMDRTSFLRIESGDRKITDIEMLAIAAALRVPVTDLFEELGK